MPRTSIESMMSKAFAESLTEVEETLDFSDMSVIADHLAPVADKLFKAGAKKLREDNSALTTRNEALTAQKAEADARIAALEAEIAKLKAEATAKPKAKAAPKPKPKHGRMQNQILGVNLKNGEEVYRKVGRGSTERTFTAIWDSKAKTLTCAELQEEPFSSPSAFARACAFKVLGDGGKSGHAINGWDVCWVERDAKKYKLSALRTAAAPPAEEEAEADDAEEADSDDGKTATTGDGESSSDEEEDDEEEDDE